MEVYLQGLYFSGEQFISNNSELGRIVKLGLFWKIKNEGFCSLLVCFLRKGEAIQQILNKTQQADLIYTKLVI